MIPSGRQLSLFGAEAVAPTPNDVEGLLAGAGQVTRMGGTARVSIVVDDFWRVAALQEEFRVRGLASGWEHATVDGHYGVRTAYSAALAGLGVRWLRGALKSAPAQFGLDGLRLRLWALGSGVIDSGGKSYTFRLGHTDGDVVWKAVGKSLAAAGLPSVLLGPRAGGPAYRVAGRRRLARLVELVGEAPVQAPPGAWPQ